MNPLSNTSQNLLRGNLYHAGFESIPKFARENGFNPETVKIVLWRHCGKETRPRGEVTMNVIEALKPYIKEAQ